MNSKTTKKTTKKPTAKPAVKKATAKKATAKKPVAKKRAVKTKAVAEHPFKALFERYDRLSDEAQIAWRAWDGKQTLCEELSVDFDSVDGLGVALGAIPVAPGLKPLAQKALEAVPQEINDASMRAHEAAVDMFAYRFPMFDRKTLMLMVTMCNLAMWCADGLNPAIFTTVAVALEATEKLGFDIYGFREEGIVTRRPGRGGGRGLAGLLSMLAKAGGRCDD